MILAIIISKKRSIEIEKTKHNFCSHSCSATFTNKHRPKKEKSDKEIDCIKCGIPFLVDKHSYIKICNDCKNKDKIVDKNGNILKLSNCLTCSIDLYSRDKKRKYCDICRQIIFQINGKINAAKNCKRSKNEIYFANLCIKEFQNVSTNDSIFVSKYGNWDADVVLNDHKVAVLWDGIWHFKKVRRNHSPKQVQARDKIKKDVILSNGFLYYIIKDMGKEKPSFVENKFEKFKQFIRDLEMYRKIIDLITECKEMEIY